MHYIYVNVLMAEQPSNLAVMVWNCSVHWHSVQNCIIMIVVKLMESCFDSSALSALEIVLRGHSYVPPYILRRTWICYMLASKLWCSSSGTSWQRVKLARKCAKRLLDTLLSAQSLKEKKDWANLLTLRSFPPNWARGTFKPLELHIIPHQAITNFWRSTNIVIIVRGYCRLISLICNHILEEKAGIPDIFGFASLATAIHSVQKWRQLSRKSNKDSNNITSSLIVRFETSYRFSINICASDHNFQAPRPEYDWKLETRIIWSFEG